MRYIDKYYGKIAWILTGICFAAAVAVMLICGSFNLERFYDVGEVYDVPQMYIKLGENYDVSYNEIENIHTITAENASKNFWVSEGKWNYIYLYFDEISGGSFHADLMCYNTTDGVVDCQQNVSLFEGENLIKIPDVKYSRLYISIHNQIGVSFRLKKVQFRETEPVFSRSRFLKYTVSVFLIYCLITGILLAFMKKYSIGIPWYVLVKGLQRIFLHIGKAGEKVTRRISREKRGFLRSGIFCFLFLFMQMMYIVGMTKLKTYPYMLLICVIGLIWIALLCWEKPLKYLNWNNHLVESWLILWVIAGISDIIVKKRFMFVSYSMIFIVGFLFFMWGNMERREVLLKDFIRGIEWSFFFNVLFCYLFRPYVPGCRYLGGAYEPGYFGMYLLFVWISFLTELDFNFKDRKVFGKDLCCIFLLGICGDLIWKTQTISAMLPAGLAAFVFSFRLWKKRKQVRIKGILFYLILLYIGHTLNGYCIYHIPRQLNAEIKFEQDLYLDAVTEHPFMLTVKAEENGTANRILYKLKTSHSLEELTTRRTLYWKAYLRDMNFWGHKRNAQFWGEGHMAHNGLLAIMHRYGVFAGIPYVLMLIFNMGYAWRCFKKHLFKERYAYFILVDMICCYALLFVENLELPFCWLYWYSLYIVMGIYFEGEKVTESLSQC